MTASLDQLGATAQALLTAMAAELEALGVVLPTRQYLPPALLVAWDEPQLTVALHQLAQGQPGGEFGGTFFPPTQAVFQATFIVTLIRDVAALNGEGRAGTMVPSADEMQMDGLALLDDARALILAAQAVHAGYQVAGQGQGFVIGPCYPVGPAGALAGNQLQVSMSLS